MKKWIFLIVTSILTIGNLYSAEYVFKIEDLLVGSGASGVSISCSDGFVYGRGRCNPLVERVDGCPNGTNPYGINQCLSETQILRFQECPPGYTYSVADDICTISINQGAPNDPNCNGSYSGCSATFNIPEGTCTLTCDGGTNIFDSTITFTCAVGSLTGGNCIQQINQPYSYSPCGPTQLASPTYCQDITPVEENICPTPLLPYNETYCY